MHFGNRKWMADCKIRYPDFFGEKVSVLELGSYNVNGTVRDFFPDAKKYVGVDIAEGPCVDIVSPADQTQFEQGEFDVLVCLSLFEHDPNWRVSFSHNFQWIKRGGMIFICWGAEGNLYHLPDPWAIVPVGDFMVAAQDWPIKIVDAFFEEARYCKNGASGAFDVVAIKK